MCIMSSEVISVYVSIEAYCYVHVHNCIHVNATQSQLMSYVQCHGFVLRFQVVNHNIPYSDTKLIDGESLL